MRVSELKKSVSHRARLNVTSECKTCVLKKCDLNLSDTPKNAGHGPEAEKRAENAPGTPENAQNDADSINRAGTSSGTLKTDAQCKSSEIEECMRELTSNIAATIDSVNLTEEANGSETELDADSETNAESIFSID